MDVYVLKTCDTCRKARKWLEAEGIEANFIDVRADGLDGEAVGRMLKGASPETLVNRRSTTWRQLPADKRSLFDEGKIGQLLTENPTLLKRPVFVDGNNVLVGFTAAVQEALLGAK